ncbi:protein CNPPD1-like isoform X1 [Penaeus indicus]|uniref:protein CNPPD1-like isoform X1 n=1 Tax=Penaeus indicus TaxID=29960 RepID=UPI00300C52F7
MKTPKTPDKLSSSHFSKFLPEYVEYAERIRKTLYYGKLPSTDRPSLPFTSISVEKFSELCRQDGLEKLDLRYASSVCYDACITPCSLILALVYLERLRCNNPEYLATASPSQIFLVAVMVASKYLYDDGEEDEVFNDEWATSAALPLSDLNKAEREFLVAIDWNLFVDADAFLKAFEQVEGEVAWREGERRGYFTYTDLLSLGQTLPGSCTAVLNLMSHVFAVCMVGYTAAILSAVAGTLLAQECSQQISTALHQWTSDLVTTSETSSACPNTTDLLADQESLTQSVNMLPGEIEDTDEVGNGKVNLTGLPSHALTTLTTSILLAISSPGRTRQQHHQQYLTKPDDCHGFDLSKGEAIWKKQKRKTFDTFDELDDLEFDPADLRLTFTTGSYWPPSSVSRRLAHDSVILSRLPNLDLNSDVGSHDQKSDGIYSSLWTYPKPSYQALPIYNTISNFSGIGAPNLHGSVRTDGRAGGWIEWLSWVCQAMQEVLVDLVPETQETALLPPPMLSRVAVAYS